LEGVFVLEVVGGVQAVLKLGVKLGGFGEFLLEMVPVFF
jgi:hypothetical protein